MKRVHTTPARWTLRVKLVGLFCLALCIPSAVTVRSGDEQIKKAPGRAADWARMVTIRRDTYGVPHVYGPTDASCVFGFVYAQAEDYFWQIEDSYLRSLGRAAEVYGEPSLPDDLVNRALEISGLSRKEYENSTPKTKEICQAVAEALNYYLAVNPRTKPRLITHFEPWHPLAFRRFILYQSFIYGKSGLQVSDILGAVKEIRDGKLGAVAFPPDGLESLVAIERDRQSMSRARRLQHVGRQPGEVDVGESAHVHQSAPAVLRTGPVV